MIDLIPAIDLIDGSCVRLVEGDFSRKTDYGKDPVEMAVFFADAGFKRLHVVDLDGARTGSPVHIPLLAEMAKESRLNIDFGGGVREAQQIEDILKAGAKQVSLGSIAVKEPNVVESWIKGFGPDVIFLGADLKEGKIATHAWSEISDYGIIEYLEFWITRGITRVFCTDVSKDGKLSGPALELYIRIKKNFPDLYLTASGGVAVVDDIRALEDAGIDAVIFGKAFYEGKIRINELNIWL